MNSQHHDWDHEEQDALAGFEPQFEVIRQRHRRDPSFELLRAAHGDALPSDLQESVSDHIASNAMSRTLSEGLDPEEPTLTPEEQNRLLARILREAKQTPASSRTWGWLRPAMLTSGVLALSAGLWFISLRIESPERLSPPETTVVIAEPAPLPAFLLPFEKPEVRLGMSALTWRGTTGSSNQLLSDLKPGLDAYRKGDYQNADRELTAIATKYPGTIEVLFYQGVSRLFLNDLPGAISSLTAAEQTGDKTFLADIAWYRAVAEQRAGHTADARTRLDTLCRNGSDGAPRACTALTQLEASSSTPR